MIIKVQDKVTGEWIVAPPARWTKAKARRFAKLAVSRPIGERD